MQPMRELDVLRTIPVQLVIAQGRTNRSNFCGRGGGLSSIYDLCLLDVSYKISIHASMVRL